MNPSTPKSPVLVLDPALEQHLLQGPIDLNGVLTYEDLVALAKKCMLDERPRWPYGLTNLPIHG